MEKYSAGAVSRPTLFKDAVVLTTLLLQGVERDELVRRVEKENLLRYNAPDRRRQIASAVLRRLETLSPKALGLLEKGGLEGKKAILMLSVLKTDRYLREFMLEIYADRVQLGLLEITDSDFDRFYTYKKEQSEEVAAWTPVTVKKLKQVYKKMLVDLGFAKGRGAVFQMTPPLMTKELKDIIREESFPIKKIFLGRDWDA